MDFFSAASYEEIQRGIFSSSSAAYLQDSGNTSVSVPHSWQTQQGKHQTKVFKNNKQSRSLML